MATLLATTESGQSMDISMVGNEGFIGVPIILESATACRIMIYMPCESQRVTADTLLTEFSRCRSAIRTERSVCLWWHDLRATFCTRLALAGYEALTIMTLMGHKDLKTTMRYIRAVQLQRNVRSQNFGHKSPTQAERPPALTAVSY